MRVVGLAILALIAVVLVRLLMVVVPNSGVFAQLEDTLVDQCRRVEVFPGAEDVAVDHELGVAFISADDRRASAKGEETQGGIFALRLDGSDRVSRVSADNFGAFHPHGISLWKGGEGQKRLFVVNHASLDEHNVEIFDVGTGGALIHIDSIAFDAMMSPNDVAAVGPREFYVTNDRGYQTGFMSQIEGYFGLPFASLAHFDGQTGRLALEGLVYANGVNVSGDGKTVYVAELLARRINAYDRLEGGALKKTKSFRVPTAPDNIDVAPNGTLYVAGHSKIFEFLKHVEDESAIAPSHAISVDPASGVVNDVFIDTNGVLNASSVAAASADQLIVGGVFDGHVMVCPRK
jgi:arylesterase/paraoxonase